MSSFDLGRAPPDVMRIARRLQEHQKRAWLVGGCVRDALLGKEPGDWDLATDAQPKELLKIFPRAIPTGIAHGTVTIVERGAHYEVTTLRGESAYSDGRRPDSVHFTSDIAEDLARRDFTVNAIAVDTVTGAVVDPWDGELDLGKRLLRAVGKAEERFQEDGLRALRAARFVATLEFDLDPFTLAAIGGALDTFKKVSAERVRDEWTKTMKAKKPSRAFEIMRQTGLLGVSCPEMLEGVDCVQNKYHAYDVWRHGMECLDACIGDPILRIAALLHDVGKPRSRAMSEKTNDYTFYDHERIGAEMTDPICRRLKFSNDERDRITALVRHHLFHYSDEWNDATVRRWLRRVGSERVDDLFRLNAADVLGKGTDPTDGLARLDMLKAHVAKVLAEGAALKTRDLAIGGRELMALGLKPGPILGEILEALLEEVVSEPSRNTKEGLLERARVFVAERKPE